MASLVESLNYTPVELSFGTSGLRGLVEDMTDLECYINTAGFLRFLQEQQGLETGSTVYVAGDLRGSTPRIIQAVIAAIIDKGFVSDFCGFIPTPAVAHFARLNDAASIMVTGSHIPSDRNGIKFYKLGGEILKDDETAIKQAVATERQAVLESDSESSTFNSRGMFVSENSLPVVNNEASQLYLERYVSVFNNKPLAGKQVVVYQHSAVGRDMLVELLHGLGADIVTVGRSDVFIPIDTENVTPDDQTYFKSLSREYPGVFAIVSTDGDSDRPFVIDENGIFHRGDELGAVVAKWLEADFAAIPVSSSDAVDQYLGSNDIDHLHTRIGSPYVIVAMDKAVGEGKTKAVGWEVNGGFLLAQDFTINGTVLSSLPTRDAFLPILIALVSAAEQEKTISELFSALPARFTQAGLIDNFPVEVSRAILDTFVEDSEETRTRLGQYFVSSDGFSEITKTDSLDGIRIFFANGDIAHLRPSGNAPQLRTYSVADSQERADEIVRLAIEEPSGILRQLGEHVIVN
ncbi:MAG: phosphomannomutase [Candidatus Saccharimonadales bacterium]